MYRLDKKGAAGMLTIELASDDETNVDEGSDDLRCPLHQALRPRGNVYERRGVPQGEARHGQRSRRVIREPRVSRSKPRPQPVPFRQAQICGDHIALSE